MKTFHILTLGCKVNQYESEEISQFLLREGYAPFYKHAHTSFSKEIKNFPEDHPWPRLGEIPLNLCIINGCAVTAEAEAKTRKTVRNFSKLYSPPHLVVFGCSATRNPDIFRKIPGVTHVVTGEETGGNRVAAVKRVLAEIISGENISENSDEKFSENGEFHRNLGCFGRRHRAYLKIQDGCRQFCTYCIVPHLRKTLFSVPSQEIENEARNLISLGHREIVLTGIHLGYYGEGIRSREEEDWGAKTVSELPVFSCREKKTDENLVAVVRRLAEMDVANLHPVLEEFPSRSKNIFRVRISSLEAEEASDTLIRVMADFPTKICPHLHLSMQSGSDAVLRRMNRPGNISRYIERCRAACESIRNLALTTDVIVGFPGEKEGDFLKTCEIAQKIGFSKIHIFRYSPREGTPAALMPDQIPGIEKQRRAEFLAEIETEMRKNYFRRFLGKEMEVLVEKCEPIHVGNAKFVLRGTSERYLPVKFYSDKNLCGEFVTLHGVEIMEDEDGILGKF